VKLQLAFTGATLFLTFGAVQARASDPGGPASVQASSAPSTGAELYAGMCAACHGEKGEGYKADHAPALANQDWLAAANDGFLRVAIAEGRPGTTMSAWSAARGGPLKPEDIDALVAYLRVWQTTSTAHLDERPVAGSAELGTAVFTARCATCHGEKGLGGTAVQIGSAQFLRGASDGFLRQVIGHGLESTAMTGFKDAIGRVGIDDLLAALRSWASGSPAPLPTSAGTATPPPIPLGPVPLNPKGPEPDGFRAYPSFTPVDVVKAELARGARLALLDARAPSDYTTDHIDGAVSVPFYDPTPYLAALPKDAWLVCYCACPHHLSGILAGKLAAAGFTKVTVLDEGFGVWKSRQYPTKSGREP